MKNDLSSGPAGDDKHTIGDDKILTGLSGLFLKPSVNGPVPFSSTRFIVMLFLFLLKKTCS